MSQVAMSTESGSWVATVGARFGAGCAVSTIREVLADGSGLVRFDEVNVCGGDPRSSLFAQASVLETMVADGRLQALEPLPVPAGFTRTWARHGNTGPSLGDEVAVETHGRFEVGTVVDYTQAGRVIVDLGNNRRPIRTRDLVWGRPVAADVDLDDLAEVLNAAASIGDRIGLWADTVADAFGASAAAQYAVDCRRAAAKLIAEAERAEARVSGEASDPICGICGVARSEHLLCGCEYGRFGREYRMGLRNADGSVEVRSFPSRESATAAWAEREASLNLGPDTCQDCGDPVMPGAKRCASCGDEREFKHGQGRYADAFS